MRVACSVSVSFMFLPSCSPSFLLFLWIVVSVVLIIIVLVKLNCLQLHFIHYHHVRLNLIHVIKIYNTKRMCLTLMFHHMLLSCLWIINIHEHRMGSTFIFHYLDQYICVCSYLYIFVICLACASLCVVFPFAL